MPFRPNFPQRKETSLEVICVMLMRHKLFSEQLKKVAGNHCRALKLNIFFSFSCHGYHHGGRTNIVSINDM